MNTKKIQVDTVLSGLQLDKAAIARRLNLDRSTVSLTLSGKRSAPETIEAITEVVADKFRELITSCAPVPAKEI